MLNDHFNALTDVGLMEFDEARDLSFGVVRLHFGVFCDLFVELEHRLIFREVLQHIEDITFLDCLLHRIEMECLVMALGVQPAEQAQRFGLGCRRERKNADIGLFAGTLDLVVDQIICVGIFLIAGAKRLGNCLHILPCGGAVGLIDDDGKVLVSQSGNCIHDVRELLDRCRNDLGVVRQLVGQVRRSALVVHHTDESSLVIHSKDRPLQLTVDNDAVCYNDDVVEDDLVIGIMQGSQSVSKPCYAVSFSAACGMLDQIVQVGAMFIDGGKELANQVKLMIAREDHCLGGLFLSCRFIKTFFSLYKDEL